MLYVVWINYLGGVSNEGYIVSLIVGGGVGSEGREEEKEEGERYGY